MSDRCIRNGFALVDCRTDGLGKNVDIDTTMSKVGAMVRRKVVVAQDGVDPWWSGRSGHGQVLDVPVAVGIERGNGEHEFLLLLLFQRAHLVLEDLPVKSALPFMLTALELNVLVCCQHTQRAYGIEIGRLTAWKSGILDLAD